MSTPLISVIMPVYNAAPFVDEAIRSVLAQTFADFELIAIDDASTDTSREILARLTDPRCRVLSNSSNLGAAETKNRGLTEAHGEFIAFLDADDLGVPERLARQLDWLRANPAVDVVGSSIEHIDSAGQSLGIFDLSQLEPRALRSRLLFQNRIAQSSVMLRRAALGTHRFRKEFEPAEDYDLWVRLAAKSNLVVSREVLVRYRLHEQSVSAVKGAAMQHAIAAIQDAQLHELGLSDPQGIHAATINAHPIPSLDLLQAIAQWLRTLQRANEEHKIHATDVFDTELRTRWLAVGTRARHLGIAGWTQWRRSTLARGNFAANLRLLARALRWELARRARCS